MFERRVLKRVAVILVLVAAGIAAFSAYVALVFHGEIDLGQDWLTNLSFPTWIMIFASPMLLIFLGMLALVLLRSTDEPTVQVQDTSEALEYAGPDLEITCGQCGQLYVVGDTGDRPLESVCPHCQAVNTLADAPAAEGAPVGEEVAVAELEEAPAPVDYDFVAAEPGGESAEPQEILVRCTNCREVFGVPYTTQRPLYADCPSCARQGVLR